MESSHKSAPWWETWWPLFVIVFGITFVTILVSFHPVN